MTSLIEYVADQFNVSYPELLFNTKTHKKEIAGARQVCMYFAKIEDINTPNNAELPFGKDRCTILHAIQTVKNHYDTEPKFREKIDHIREMIDNGEVDTVFRPLLIRDIIIPIQSVMYEEGLVSLQN